MTDIDSALEGQPIAPASLTGAEGIKAKCRRHQWVFVGNIANVEIGKEWQCWRCGTPRDEARSRRGRTAAKRGKRIQHDRIVALGGRNLAGNHENWDGQSEMFSFESKSGPSAFSDRYWRWLTAIPVLASQTRVLIVTDAPGPGHRARSYVVVEYDDWKALHGE